MCCVSAPEDERGETTTISDGLVISVDTYHYYTAQNGRKVFDSKNIYQLGTKVRLP
jgi:hypothetical protein